ncbi:hypothetical protein ABEB36_006884 [Hypothenemus hampei]
MSESHVARVAPHNYYPPVSNDDYRYPGHQFPGYNPQMKYSDLVETAQPNPISTSVIQKPKPKDYMEMCNVPQQHLVGNHHYANDNGAYMHKDPTQGYPGIFKGPESQLYPKDQHQYQPHLGGSPKFNSMMVNQNMRKYNPPPPTDNSFLNKLSKLNPNIARSIISDHHLQEAQSTYPSMDQRVMYTQQNHRYFSGSMHQPPNPYQSNPIYSLNTPHPYPTNYSSASCSYPRSPQLGPRYNPVERSLSPARRGYPEGMPMTHMNYHHSMHHQKTPPSHNYSPQFRSPEYAQHYQHRRIPQECYPPQSCSSTPFMQQHHQMSGQDMQELTETTVSPSDSLKKFIENWADEDPSAEINNPMEANVNLKDKLRDDAPPGTVYMINATDVQYFENNGIPIVTSENGGFQLTSENYQYLLKNGLVDNGGMVRIIEANKDVAADSNGKEEREVNLQITEEPKPDCMMATKQLRTNESGLAQTNMLSRSDDDDNRRVLIHQNTVLTPANERITDFVPLHQSVVDNLGSTKELVDKNCSPINLDHLEHNLDFNEPNSNSQTEKVNEELNNNKNCFDNNQQLAEVNLTEDLGQNSAGNSPSSKSMPIIDFFADSLADMDVNQQSYVKNEESNLEGKEVSSVSVQTPKNSDESSSSVVVTVAMKTASETIVDDTITDTIKVEENDSSSELNAEKVQESLRIATRKRIFSVDDIIHNIGNKFKRDSGEFGNISGDQISEFLEREVEFSSLELLTSTKSEPNEENGKGVLKVNGSLAVIEIAGELVEITVNISQGKKVINVKSLSDAGALIDCNHNYQSRSRIDHQDHFRSKDKELLEESCSEQMEVVAEENHSEVLYDELNEELQDNQILEEFNIDNSSVSSSENHGQSIADTLPENSSNFDEISVDVTETDLKQIKTESMIDEERSWDENCQDASFEDKVFQEKYDSDSEANELLDTANIQEKENLTESKSNAKEVLDTKKDDNMSDDKPSNMKESESRNLKNKFEEVDYKCANIPLQTTENCDVEININLSENTEDTSYCLPDPLSAINLDSNGYENEEIEEYVLVDASSELEPLEEIVTGENEEEENLIAFINNNNESDEIIEEDRATICNEETIVLEDEVFIEAQEVIVSDPLEGNCDSHDSPEIPLEPVTTSKTDKTVVLEDEKDIEPKARLTKPEIQILSPTSTNIEDYLTSTHGNQLKSRKYSTDNDLSNCASPPVTTKAAKKLYEVDLQVQHDTVSSSKKEDIPKEGKLIKKSKKESENKNEKKLKKEERIVNRTPVKKNQTAEQDEEYVDFKELLLARKLKKLKKQQESIKTKNVKSESKTCNGNSKNKINETKKPNKIDQSKSEDASKSNILTSSVPISEIQNVSEKISEPPPPQKRVSFSDEHPSSTSSVTAKDPQSMHPKDPRRRSKAYATEESSNSIRKRKITLADYVSRKRKASSQDGQFVEKKDALEPEETTKSIPEIFHSSNWEDSHSPLPPPSPPSRLDLDNQCLIRDFSGLMKTSPKILPVIDVNELCPKDKTLQEYKETVDSKLSTLNIQIPMKKPQTNPLINHTPETSCLISRFMNNEKLNEIEMAKIRNIISFKRSMKNQKNVKSPSRSPQVKVDNGYSDSGSSSTYEIRNEESTMRLHLRKVNSRRKSQLYSDSEEGSSSVIIKKKCEFRRSKSVGYSVINRLGENGQPKIIFKRNKGTTCSSKEPVVELVKLNLDNLEKVNKKFNVRVREIM